MRFACAVFLVAVACSGSGSTSSSASGSPDVDLKEARTLFEANIRAIQEKNREAYLACYREDELLVRAGPEGVKLGYAELAAGTATTGSDKWPSSLEASEVVVHWIQPGVVYGAYKYRVTIAGVTTEG